MNEQQEHIIKRIITNPLYVSAFVLMLGSICLYLAAHYWFTIDVIAIADDFSESIKTASQQPSTQATSISANFVNEFMKIAHRSFWREVLIHISIAFFVAAILIIAVELRMRKLHHHEMNSMRYDIANNVWCAISQKSLPATITRQIDNLLQQDFIKEHNEYILTLEPLPGKFNNSAYSGKEDEYILVTTENRYFIKNISGQSRQYDFAYDLCSQYPDLTVLSNDESTTIYPTHRSLEVDGQNVLSDASVNKLLKYSTELLPAGKGYEIKHVCSHIHRIADVDFYTEMRPVDGVKLTVHNQAAERVKVKDAYLAHPMLYEFMKNPSYQRRTNSYENLTWQFSGGLLPGHTIIVMWEALSA